MTTLQKRILADLKIGPSTIDNIATRFGITDDHATKELAKLADGGKVMNRPLAHAPKIIIWKLT